uniref:BOS complex subunit TMEM147 n=1 Tax=Fagus sylvatica TaxID=28930 RepID=A0A2N9IWT3_FAGSY
MTSSHRRAGKTLLNIWRKQPDWRRPSQPFWPPIVFDLGLVISLNPEPHRMTVFHFFNCAILTFGPHAVYYSATPLSEYDTLGTSIKASLVYLGTALVKLVCLATFLKVSENDSFDPYQELLKALIGFIDVAGLYFALTQLTHRNIAQNHKFQAVGLGWAFADSVLHRLAPLWVGARGLEFTWDYILQGIEANANLKLGCSIASDNILNSKLLGHFVDVQFDSPKWIVAVVKIVR